MVLWFKVFVLPFKTVVSEHFYISNSKCNVLKTDNQIANWNEYFFLYELVQVSQAISFLCGF